MIRLVLREIRANFGRWFAILAIIALGTGFLAGLMQTAPAMLQTMREYVRESRLYDWRAVMPDGFDGALLDEASSVRGVRAASSRMAASGRHAASSNGSGGISVLPGRGAAKPAARR